MSSCPQLERLLIEDVRNVSGTKGPGGREDGSQHLALRGRTISLL